jgi:plasmid maintenance system antidote protein VapI
MKTDVTRAELQFRNYLKRELEVRKEKNPKYSLRAFSRFLEMDHGHVSKILVGRCPVTRKTLNRVSKKLGGTSAQFRKLVRQVRST